MSEEEFGKALKRLRESKSLSETEVARRARFGPAIVTRTESGLQYPSIDSLVRWLEVLETTPVEFFAQFGPAQQRKSKDVRIAIGYEDWYRLLTEIIESDQKFFKDGIHANLVAMASAAISAKEGTAEQSGNIAAREKKRSRKQRSA